MIKRSVPITLVIKCQTTDYADGIKDGIMHTLQCLMHECDIIMRVSPSVHIVNKENDNETTQYVVRSRFTVREKKQGRDRGEWIKINSSYYEEEMDDKFDTDREWKSLNDMEVMDICNFAKGQNGEFFTHFSLYFSFLFVKVLICSQAITFCNFAKVIAFRPSSNSA